MLVVFCLKGILSQFRLAVAPMWFECAYCFRQKCLNGMYGNVMIEMRAIIQPV